MLRRQWESLLKLMQQFAEHLKLNPGQSEDSIAILCTDNLALQIREFRHHPEAGLTKGKVHYQSGLSVDFATGSNNGCLVNDEEIGGACSFDAGISLSLLKLTLFENSSPICAWIMSTSMNPDICLHLTSDKNTFISNYTIKINKKEDDFVTYRWDRDASSVAITLDWTQSGISSEVIECRDENS
ncbi:unnamed protein product [Hymenolepis diminuta]|uniref:DUF5727 domain-containing protein n=1 Tax=Hymenolepis diminuta TaxID=6216 RepID=A0A0R3S8C7_HYMDI|nr:unnamed protein product [Hymenolepis diminuta]